jgi:hypothetical protein
MAQHQQQKPVGQRWVWPFLSKSIRYVYVVSLVHLKLQTHSILRP